MEIAGLKLIFKTGGVNLDDDPSYPFKLKANFSPPQFMEVAFITLYGGSEEFILRGMTAEALQQFIEVNDLRTHPRLRWLKLTGPSGLIEEVKR